MNLPRVWRIEYKYGSSYKHEYFFEEDLADKTMREIEKAARILGLDDGYITYELGYEEKSYCLKTQVYISGSAGI